MNGNAGYLTILVSGVVAAVIGLLIGIATADLVARDDLSGLGVAVIWLIALGSVGAGIGVGVGLTAKGQAKPGLAAVLATPAVFVLSFGALVSYSEAGARRFQPVALHDDQLGHRVDGRRRRVAGSALGRAGHPTQ